MQRLTGDLHKPGPPAADLFDDEGLDANGRYFKRAGRQRRPRQTYALIAGTGESTEKLTAIVARADALMPLLPAQDRVFFNDNLRVQVRFLLAASGTVHNLALAERDKMPDDGAHKADRTMHLRAAQAAALQMRAALDQAEHGPFVGWYKSDSTFGVNARIKDITALLQAK